MKRGEKFGGAYGAPGEPATGLAKVPHETRAANHSFDDGLGCFRGLFVALPVGVLLWALIAGALYWAVLR